jgi:Ca2+-binding RTX toxin-like protein
MLIINVDGDLQTLTGGSGNDQLIADWVMNDRLNGNAGNDLLIGGQGNNQIYGGSGNDVIFGWKGNDFLSGGSGVDTFVFTKNADAHWGFTTGRDTISDFTAGAGGDIIDITDVAPGTFLTFDGTNHLVASAAAVQSGADTLIILGTNDSIRLTGVTLTNLTTANFENVHFNLDGFQI